MYLKGYSVSAISRELKIDCRTAKKYVKHSGKDAERLKSKEEAYSTHTKKL
ncbi:hypothetical protein PHOSAC3_370002 [Mesotoga infera]|nr:hypothetical protein PHOSAC3_370002 [Mesotoga infera]